jgi:HD-GYP domain-containing protein (c-di-GMP phosphodiesterase class II)
MALGRLSATTVAPSTKDAPSGPLALADRTKADCQALLADALRAIGGHAGAIFAVHKLSAVDLVVSEGANRPNESEALERAARRGLSEGQALMVAAPSLASRGRRDRGLTAILVVPAYLDDAVVAVLVVSGADKADVPLEECVRRTRALVLPIALSVDRVRMETALDQRVEDMAALHRQLDVYAVDIRSTYLAERDRSQQLAAALDELERTYSATVRGLAVAVEAKDECTGGHLQRVCRYGMRLTALVAPDHATDAQFEYGFLLHDVGKLTVPDAVLLKPGALTDAEWELMRQHPGSGRSILEGIPFLAGAREIVYAHHERWDGKGYPRGLIGDEIPLGAQIFPICDAFDAMTSDRPYRKASSIDHARDQVSTGRGGQFWPDAVDAFLSLPVDELEAVRDLRHEASA